MADDKDHLARMLSALADGEHRDEPGHAHGNDSIEQPAPTPARNPAAPNPGPPKPSGAGAPTGGGVVGPRPVVKAPAARPKAVPNPEARAAGATPVPHVRPRVGIPQPKPAGVAVPKVRVTPVTPIAPTGVQSPPSNVRAAAPTAPGQVPSAAAEQEVYEEPAGEDEVAAGYENREEMQADDRVIVPAPSREVLAHGPVRPPPRPGHLARKLVFKQALIPVCLSLFVVCGGFVLIGLLSGEDSPYAAFKRTGIAVSFGLVALVMLVIGVVTMLQVKSELGRHGQ